MTTLTRHIHPAMMSLLLALLHQRCHGFVSNPAPLSSARSHLHPNRPEPIILTNAAAAASSVDEGEGEAESVGVELVSLAGLGDDHEAVGDNMAKSVAAWLDAEWMPQEVHVKMGVSVKDSYVACRSVGVEEVAEIMTRVTDDLYDRWAEYNADAFVNAWDVGNYVADYLIAKSGSETCGCSTQIVD